MRICEYEIMRLCAFVPMCLCAYVPALKFREFTGIHRDPVIIDDEEIEAFCKRTYIRMAGIIPDGLLHHRSAGGVKNP